MKQHKYIFIFDAERILIDNINLIDKFIVLYPNSEIYLQKSDLPNVFDKEYFTKKANFHYFETTLLYRFIAKLCYIFKLENVDFSLKEKTIRTETNALKYFYDIFRQCFFLLRIIKVSRKFKFTNYLIQNILIFILTKTHPLKYLILEGHKVCLFVNSSQSPSFVFFENCVINKLKNNAFFVVEGWDNLSSKLFLSKDECTVLLQSQQTYDHLLKFSKVKPNVFIIGQARINSNDKKGTIPVGEMVCFMPSNSVGDTNWKL